jgi:hypothetical protein
LVERESGAVLPRVATDRDNVIRDTRANDAVRVTPTNLSSTDEGTLSGEVSSGGIATREESSAVASNIASDTGIVAGEAQILRKESSAELRGEESGLAAPMSSSEIHATAEPLPSNPVRADGEVVGSEISTLAGRIESQPAASGISSTVPAAEEKSIAATLGNSSTAAVAEEGGSATSVNEAPIKATVSNSEGAATIVTEKAAPTEEGTGSETSAELSSEMPTTNGTEDKNLRNPETQTAMVLPKPPPVADQSGRIRAFFNENGSSACFLAIPTSVRSDGAEADVYGEAQDSFAKFADGFAGAVDAGLSLNRTLISKTQCSALDIVKSFFGGDHQTLTLVLASNEVADGDDLVADVKGAPYPWLSVLIIDDEGQVTDVSGFIHQEEGSLRLRAPVHLSGGGRSKSQILVAVSSKSELSLLTIKGRRKLDSLLPLILGEKKLVNPATEVAIVSFKIL